MYSDTSEVILYKRKDIWVVLLRGGIDQTHPAVCHSHGHLRISAAGSPTHLDFYKHTLVGQIKDAVITIVKVVIKISIRQLGLD